MIHRPVLLAEVLDQMDPRPGQVWIDGTVGAAGHAKEVLKRILPDGFYLASDRDPQVAELAARALISAGFTRGEQFDVEVRRYSQFDGALAHRRYSRFDRLFLDLGVCSLHLDEPERGFSFKRDGALDMRMNPQESDSQSAADLVNGSDEEGLARIFREYGEEKFSRRVARAIVAARTTGEIHSTLQLQRVVAQAIPRKAWPPKTDPATTVFQALRIAVNRELEELDVLLAKLEGSMVEGSRVGIISFHSLEDRRVKEKFRRLSRSCICPPEFPVCRCGGVARFRMVSSKAAVAGEDEIAENPRARSAKLRVLEKL